MDSEEKTEIKENDNENNSMFFGVISSLKIFQDKYLFAGTGNFLSLYNIKENDYLIDKIKIFESEKISKINIFNYTNDNEYIIVLSGETKIKYSLFKISEFKFKFNEIITKSHDYIMDHIYYSHTNENDINQYLIIGFINNFIEIYRYNKDNNSFEFIKFLFSSVKCIVYSMAFSFKANNNNNANELNQDYDSILIASGTVFRKVILWQINYIRKENQFIKDEKNILELTGHKGVIFSVHFYSNDILCSTSDDRVTKLYKYDLPNKKFISEDYTGHSSRIWDSKIYLPKNILVSVSEDATALIYNLDEKKCIAKLKNAHEGWNIRSVEINENYIWTGGEDGRLIKSKYSGINLNENDNKIINEEKKEIVIKIKNEGKQFELACEKQKQKNFKCSIKVVKFIDENIVILGTNHGQILGYDFNKDNNKNIVLFEDKEARVVNSIDIIQECNLIIVGLNDGMIVVISYGEKSIDNQNNKFESYLIKIFNERVAFISHKIIENNNIFIIISSEKSKTKICFIKEFNQNKIIETLQNENSFLYFISPFGSQINTFEIKEVDNNDLIQDRNRYIIFLGDYEGKIYFTQIKNISNKLYLFSNLLKYLHIFKKSIITSIIYSSKQKTLFIYSRNTKIKKYVITNEYSSSLFSLKEIESQGIQGISSYEKILYQNLISFEEDKYFIIGHNGRDLIIYDTYLKKIIHKNDVKGVNKPLDLYLDNKNNKIYYISCQSELSKIFSIEINQNKTDNINENPHNELLISNSYCLPVNGRVIHDIGLLHLEKNNYLLFTAGEDTKVKFYYISNVNDIFGLGLKSSGGKSIIFLGDFKMHDCAVRKITFIHKINNEFYFCSIGAKKEIFLFKLILDDIEKPKFICIENLSQNKSNSFKPKSKIKIESNVENSRNMDLCILNINNNNKYELAITDNIDETSICQINFNNEVSIKDDLSNIKTEKRCIKFNSSNFIPLCICYCTNKFILYGQSNGILRIYNKETKKEDFVKLHEAGINEIKINLLSSNNDTYLIFTCGEDCTLVISEFNITNSTLNIINKIKTLHFSAIKSIDILQINNEFYIITGGYDQIVNIIKYNKGDYTFKVIKTFHVCVSEINSLKGCILYNDNKEKILYITIGGLGIEFLKYKL